MQEILMIKKQEYVKPIEELTLADLKKMSQETGVPLKVYKRMVEAEKNIKKKKYYLKDLGF